MRVPAKVYTCAVVGLDGQLVEVEVDIASGLPAFHVVGLPDAAVQEARERVRAAVRNSGFSFPFKRITANLVRYGVSLRTDVRRHDKAIARIDANLERLSENLIEITDKSR